MIVAGIGCRPACPAAEILDLLARGGRRPDLIATVAARLSAPGLAAAAATLGLPLAGFSAARLADEVGRITTPSALAGRHLGTPSVAEAAALAAAGPGGRLILSRIASAGATLALAEGEGP
ncbi:cobalt-precorrin 5A hydrolase [Zavarzinia compransoris]|uniref:CobE/GbiG C-terminal domain-containing protein n=2 Tax=Zavarzinia compransoris TaxID=1264899 RepID=A0A317DY12_9PROT|nr:hypothetical protein DKG75_14140 [Zavarzinia compransoris]TDP40407.1 cobalt-precorrin 5A hydrolase [Zavarzinia compransoris]